MKKLTDEIKQALEAATPGPWEVMNRRDIFTPAGATNRTGITADPNDGWHIADVMCGPTMVGGGDWEMGYVERYANAHLIANAPTWLTQLLQEREQMVEALKDALMHSKAKRSIVAEAHIEQFLKQVGELE